jgi:hypothetical protein
MHFALIAVGVLHGKLAAWTNLKSIQTRAAQWLKGASESWFQPSLMELC